jgi:hypothetical protein
MFTEVLFVAVLALAALAVSRGLAGWRWCPSRLAMLLMLPLLGLLLWRIFPELLFIPIVIPLFWTWRRGSPSPRRDGERGIIDVPYRRLDER